MINNIKDQNLLSKILPIIQEAITKNIINCDVTNPLDSYMDVEIGDVLNFIDIDANKENSANYNPRLTFFKGDFKGDKNYSIALDMFLRLEIIVDDQLIDSCPNHNFKLFSNLDKILSFRYNLDSSINNVEHHNTLYWAKENSQFLGKVLKLMQENGNSKLSYSINNQNHFFARLEQTISLTCIGYYFIKDENRIDENGYSLPRLNHLAYKEEERKQYSKKIRELHDKCKSSSELIKNKRIAEKTLKTIRDDFQEVYKNIEGYFSFAQGVKRIPVFLLGYSMPKNTFRKSEFLDLLMSRSKFYYSQLYSDGAIKLKDLFSLKHEESEYGKIHFKNQVSFITIFESFGLSNIDTNFRKELIKRIRKNFENLIVPEVKNFDEFQIIQDRLAVSDISKGWLSQIASKPQGDINSSDKQFVTSYINWLKSEVKTILNYILNIFSEPDFEFKYLSITSLEALQKSNLYTVSDSFKHRNASLKKTLENRLSILNDITIEEILTTTGYTCIVSKWRFQKLLNNELGLANEKHISAISYDPQCLYLVLDNEDKSKEYFPLITDSLMCLSKKTICEDISHFFCALLNDQEFYSDFNFYKNLHLELVTKITPCDNYYSNLLDLFKFEIDFQKGEPFLQFKNSISTNTILRALGFNCSTHSKLLNTILIEYFIKENKQIEQNALNLEVLLNKKSFLTLSNSSTLNICKKNTNDFTSQDKNQVNTFVNSLKSDILELVSLIYNKFCDKKRIEIDFWNDINLEL